MRTSRLVRRFTALTCLTAACTSPATDSGTPPPVTGVATISVTPLAAILVVGQHATLTAQAKDASGQSVTASLTWHTSSAAVATVDAGGMVTAVAVGIANITASSGTIQSPPAVVTVTVSAPGVATITVTPSTAILAVGQKMALTAQTTDTGGHLVSPPLTWQTSSATVATVDTSGMVTAVAAGTASITASSGTIQSAPVVVTVGSNAPWPTSGGSSEQLIDAALQQGTLTDEQALVYKVFALFADPRLPAAYRGIGEATVDNMILTIAGRRWPTLSATAQAQLAPFFVPPGYAESWFAARSQSVTGAPRAPLRAASRASDCEVINALFTTRTTAHFDIHYWQGDADAARVADILVTEVEKVWNVETAAFGRFPLSDANERQGSCDGAVDIWVFPLNPGSSHIGDVAWTKTYHEGCSPSPSYMVMWDLPVDAIKIRNALAHEFFHVLEFGSYSNVVGCSPDDAWISEATANWAMDLVYPGDQFEQPYAAGYVYAERRVPLDQAWGGNADKTNGYCDYIFLLYLARTYGNSMIKAIWNATEQGNSLGALAAALQSQGSLTLKEVWPAFALDLWNNYQAHAQDDFFKWDSLPWGLKTAFDAKDAGGSFGAPSVKVELQGAQKKTFTLMGESVVFPSGDNELERLSIDADYLKFTDPSVSSVMYSNTMAFADLPNLKIQALIKRGGQWQAPEDWTKAQYKNFCRDRQDERIEELALIYSNADGTRPSQPIPFSVVPRVSVSNVGCARWDGTAQITTTGLGVVNDVTATVSFTRAARNPITPDGPAGYEIFTPVSGKVAGAQTGQCPTLSAEGPILSADARLEINLDNLDLGVGPAPDRLIRVGTGSSWLATATVPCIGTTVSGTAAWSWLEIPGYTKSVSADGKTITGVVTTTGGFGSKTVRWTLTAVREP